MSTYTPLRPTFPEDPRRGAGHRGLLITGTVIAALAAVLVAGGLVGAWADGKRDSDGYLSSDRGWLHTNSAAVVVSSVEIDGAGLDGLYGGEILGTLRINVTGEVPLFVGIAGAADVDRYLGSVRHDELFDVSTSPFQATYRPHAGGSVLPGSPEQQPFWVAMGETGAVGQVLTWRVAPGDWSVVLMNADGSTGVNATVTVGVTIPVLHGITGGLLIGGGTGLAIGVALMITAAVGKRWMRGVALR